MALSIPQSRSKPAGANDLRKPLAEPSRNGDPCATHGLLQPVIDALPVRVAVLDESAVIVAVNKAWLAFAHANNFAGNGCGIGANYLDFIQASADREAVVAGPGLHDVLQGQRRDFRLAYSASCLAGRRWFQLTATLFLEEGLKRLLVCHEDVTELKMAQEAQHSMDSRIAQTREEERAKIARELHDSTAQRVFAVNLNLMGLKTLLTPGDKRVQELLADTIALGQECLQELRSISYLLRPPLHNGHEFLAALCSYIDGFCKRSAIRINLVIPSHIGRMPARVENTLFRVVQEALSNIHRHSESGSATVVLRKSGHSIVLEVRDQGKGMPRGASGGRYWSACGGLAGIEERVREIGGHLDIKPANPGTIVTATVPLEETHAGRETAA